MNSLKRYTPFGLAILFALLSSVSVYNFLQEKSGGVAHASGMTMSSTNTNSSGTIPVVVVKHTVSIGEKLAPHQLEVIPWPAGSVPQDTYQSTRNLIGKIAKSTIVSNEPVIAAKLMGEGESFSSLIPSDMRGITVPVRRSEALAEILGRGTIVDVIAMFEQNEGPAVTKVIAQNVRVLSVHKGTPGMNKASSKNMEVTLVVTPRQAEWLVTAINKAVIQLVIRNTNDGGAGTVEWMN